jgi:ABC transporter substrate binding protein
MTATMKRRQFIGLLGGAAAWPLASRAQQSPMPVIGYFSGRSPDAEAPIRVPFLKALEALGFAPDRNVAVEYRFAQGQDERLPELAAELVRRQVAILVATDRPSAVAAKAATATIPIVFTSGFDPVELGLVASFNQPGGNATGVSLSKRLGLLRELLPNQARSPLWSTRILPRHRFKYRKCKRRRRQSDNRCSSSASVLKSGLMRRSLRWQSATSPRFSRGNAAFPGDQGASRCPRCALPDSGTLRMARICHCRRPDELQHRSQ